MYNLAKKENSDMVECNFIWEYPQKIKIDIGKKYSGKHEMIEEIRVVKEILKDFGVIILITIISFVANLIQIDIATYLAGTTQKRLN